MSETNFVRLSKALTLGAMAGVGVELTGADVEALVRTITGMGEEIRTLNTRIAELEAELARRDEITTRLKEDAERLASTYVVEVFPHEWLCHGGCHHLARFGEQLDHAPDCPITLHRALMKELE